MAGGSQLVRKEPEGGSRAVRSRGKSIAGYVRLAPVLLTGIVVLAEAQPGEDRDPFSGGALGCSSLSSASRTRGEACDEGSETTLEAESEITLTVELPAPDLGPQCDTRIELEYFQRNTIARVNGTIDSGTCAAPSGEYDIEIRVRDESGARSTLRFSESWQRDDDQPIEFTADYPIGENVELLSIRSGSIHCTCVDRAGE